MQDIKPYMCPIVGDIIKNREVIEVIKIHKPNRKYDYNIEKYKLKCLRCGSVYTYSREEFDGLNENYCKHCRYTYNINGKVYYSCKDIAKDLGVDRSSVTTLLRKYGNLDRLGVGKGRIPVENRRNKARKVVYKGIEYPTLSDAAKALKTGTEIIRRYLDENNVIKPEFDFRKQHKYIYNAGDIENGWEVLERVYKQYSDRKRTLYKVKCQLCGNIKVCTSLDIKKHNCSCLRGHKSGLTQITTERPRCNRKYDLPKNVYYAEPEKKNPYWYVQIYASKKCFYIRCHSKEEALRRLPQLKYEALQYKKNKG